MPTDIAINKIAKTINSKYYYLLGLSNTTYSREYIDYVSPCPALRNYSLLHMIRNSSSMTFRPGDKEYMSTSDLFRVGETFSLEEFNSQFVNNNTLDNSLELPIRVTVESLGDTAVLNIDVY